MCAGGDIMEKTLTEVDQLLQKISKAAAMQRDWETRLSGKPECDTSVRPLAGIFRNTVPEEKKEEPILKKVEEIKHMEARTILESDHAETSKASERTMSSAKTLREFKQMDWVPIDFGEIFDKRRLFPNQKGMANAVEMDFPPVKHAEQPYDLETTEEVLQKLFSEEKVDPDHVAEAKRIMGIKPEASPFVHLAEIYAIGSDEEEKTSPRIDCKVNNIDCKALCDIGAQVSVLSSKIFNEIHDHTIELVQTTTILIMGDGRIVKPIIIARNLEDLISGKHIPTDFFIVDVYYDKNDHVILGRPFLKLVNAVLDARKGKVTMNLDGDNHTNNFLLASRIALPLPLDDEEVESLHFVETFRDPLQRAMESETNNKLDEELIEATKGLEPQDGSLEEDKFEDIGEIKREEPQVPEVDLKPLPKGLKYEFLGPDKTYPVIVSDKLSPEENDMLLNLLKKHKKVI
jgi:hypothetical protein